MATPKHKRAGSAICVKHEDYEASIDRRKKEFMVIFVNGKQKRVRRPPTIDGIDADEFILRNADPLWLHQNEMWEYRDASGPGEETTSGGSWEAARSLSDDVETYGDEAMRNEDPMFFQAANTGRQRGTPDE